jgi:hypothetical protein
MLHWLILNNPLVPFQRRHEEQQQQPLPHQAQQQQPKKQQQQQQKQQSVTSATSRGAAQLKQPPPKQRHLKQPPPSTTIATEVVAKEPTRKTQHCVAWLLNILFSPQHFEDFLKHCNKPTISKLTAGDSASKKFWADVLKSLNQSTPCSDFDNNVFLSVSGHCHHNKVTNRVPFVPN